MNIAANLDATYNIYTLLSHFKCISTEYLIYLITEEENKTDTLYNTEIKSEKRLNDEKPIKKEKIKNKGKKKNKVKAEPITLKVFLLFRNNIIQYMFRLKLNFRHQMP